MQRVGCIRGLGIVGVAATLVVTPVARTVEVALLHTTTYARRVAHLEDVYLATAWPAHLLIVGAE